MPIYEYRCAGCRQPFEKLVRMGTREAPPCPHCGAGGAERLVSATAWIAGDCGPTGLG